MSQRESGQRRPSRRRAAAAARSILVVPEGVKTEPAHLGWWAEQHRESVTVDIRKSVATSPLEIVRTAVEARRSEAYEASRGRGAAHDEYWCVFDRDVHLRVPEAFAQADANGIKVAFSNPCIELWFLLHFQEQWADIRRHDVQRASQGILNCGKSLTPAALEMLARNYEVARERAQKLDRKHDGDGSPARSNPSSNVWELVESIKSAS